jgi:hypothetical protein
VKVAHVEARGGLRARHVFAIRTARVKIETRIIALRLCVREAEGDDDESSE